MAKFKGNVVYRLCTRFAVDEVSVARVVFEPEDGEPIPMWIKRRKLNPRKGMMKMMKALAKEFGCKVSEIREDRSRVRVRSLDGTDAAEKWGGLQGALTAAHRAEDLIRLVSSPRRAGDAPPAPPPCARANPPDPSRSSSPGGGALRGPGDP